MEEEKEHRNVVRMALVGDRAVGKKSLLFRFKDDKFPIKYVNYEKDLDVIQVRHNNVVVDLHVFIVQWESVNEKLSSRPVDVIVLLFGVDDPKSFANVSSKWIPAISVCCEGVPVILVGAKTDLRQDTLVVNSLKDQGMTMVQSEDGRDMKDEVGAREYLECCSLCEDGQEIFHTAISTVLPPQPKKKCMIL
eukprot:TRINITY_DN6627_c0_g1_i2.p1 TRINITY_DN6627_c0_g1~~TRINITY_DN6627_c0_g1_i2.p1  ORF type:complete len:200 (-),score=39.21 TRINITY_DN6627_c0_g1_i2:32-607(-)